MSKIGFFDSGIGGVTVLVTAMDFLPKEDFIYYADTANVPYGTKTTEEVKQYIFDAVDFMAGQDIKALVIACNTATSIAITPLRQKYPFPIIGMEPAVKPAVEINENKGTRVLVLATPLTLKETKYHNLVSKVDPNHIVDSLATPELVEFAERIEFSDEKIISYLKEKLASYDIDQYGTVVLGCTHFPFFIKSMQKVFNPHTNFIHGAYGTVRNLKNILADRNLLGGGKGEVCFYSSDQNNKITENFFTALNIYKELLK